MFSDAYVEKEDNVKLIEVILRYLSRSPDVRLNGIDAEDPEVNDMNFLPDTGALAETIRSCLQESDTLPADFGTLFRDSLHRLSTDMIPEVTAAYKRLEVDHKPLSLIPPEFDTPLPPLQPAVFPPVMRDPPPPALDLFDLDEQFASERVRLAQLTNKCSDEDVDYFVRESGEILGVTSELPSDARDAKHILVHVLKQLVQYKKLNADSDGMERRTNTPNHGVAFASDVASF
jgi:intraflagellar transport protein 52